MLSQMYLFLSVTIATIIKTGLEYFLLFSFSVLQCNLFTLGAFKMLMQQSFGKGVSSFTSALFLSSISFQIHSLIHVFYSLFFSNHLFHYISKDSTTIHFSVCFFSIYKTDLLPNCLHVFPFVLNN